MRSRVARILIVLAVAGIVGLLSRGERVDPPAPELPPRQGDTPAGAVFEAPPETADLDDGDSEEVPYPGDTIPAASSDWDLRPVAVSDGPLLLVWHREKSENGRETFVHAIVDAEQSLEPLAFLRHRKSIRIAGRFDRDRLLIQVGDLRSYEHPVGEVGRDLRVLDLRAARVRPFSAGTRCLVLAVENGEAYVLDLTDGRLLAVRATEPEAVRALFERTVRSVIARGEEHIFVLTDEEPSEIWRVALRGGVTRRIGAPDGEWMRVWSRRWKASPDGSRLALGVPSLWKKRTNAETGEVEHHDGPKIVVIDVVTGTRRVVARDIPIGVSLISSQMPSVELTWVDDRTIRFSETEGDENDLAMGFRWVDVDVVTGERKAERRYARLGIAHEEPPRDLTSLEDDEWRYDRWRRGKFRRDDDALYLDGDEEPVTRTPSSTWPVELEASGRFAALRAAGEGDPVLTVVDAKRRTVHALPACWIVFEWIDGIR